MTVLCRVCGADGGKPWAFSILRRAAILHTAEIARVNLCPECAIRLMRGTGVFCNFTPLREGGKSVEFVRRPGQSAAGGLFVT